METQEILAALIVILVAGVSLFRWWRGRHRSACATCNSENNEPQGRDERQESKLHFFRHRD